MTVLRKFWRLLIFGFSMVFTMASIFFVGMLLLAPQGVQQSVDLEVLNLALERVGAETPDYKTMVVGGTVEAEAPPEAVWRLLIDLDRWGDWCPMTRGGTRWIEGYQWVVGAQFQHEVELGFPLGSVRTTAFVEQVSAQRRLQWMEQRRGAQVCRIWQIEPIPGGGSRITCVEASRSLSTAFTRSFTTGPLQRAFEAALERLAEKAAEQERAPVSVLATGR